MDIFYYMCGFKYNWFKKDIFGYLVSDIIINSINSNIKLIFSNSEH